MAAERRDRGVTVATWSDGRQQVRPLPLDPVPRIVPAAEWAALAAGIEQRHRALNAFLAEAYRAAGRRRNDADRAPQVVRAGVLPDWAVAHSPGRDPDAVGQAWPGQPRATVAGMTCCGRPTARGWWPRTICGRRPVSATRWPTGRASAVHCRPCSPRAGRPILSTPCRCCGRDWRRRHRRGRGTPWIAVLTSGESDNAWFEHRVLADALGAPLVRAADLWPRLDGGVEVRSEASGCPSTSSTAGSTTACSERSACPSAHRWTRC